MRGGIQGASPGSTVPTVPVPREEVVRRPVQPTFEDVDIPVARSELVLGGARGSIPALVNPAFARDWSGIDRSLADGDLVIGVGRAGRARAYPLAVLSDHEVVNDEFDGPLLVTYCPLCASGVTAVRTVGDEPTVFSASGYLYRADLVMYDHATGSLWSQLLATAIRGSVAGEQLTLVPSTLTTWKRWQSRNPDTAVLLPPPASDTVTAPLDPLPPPGSQSSGHVGVGDVLDGDDDRLPPRELVIGVTAPEATTAYPLERVRAAGVVNDWVGALPVVVVADPLPQAYVRWANGAVLTFVRGGDGQLLAGGSTWSTTSGEAVSGPLAGTTLVRAATTTSMYWSAWVDFHPDTAVYRVGGRSGRSIGQPRRSSHPRILARYDSK